MKITIGPEPLSNIFVGQFLHPTGYTRLEPQSVTGDPDPGVAARVHDPLWMLLRQWQFGELAGEDAGQPLSVKMVSTSLPVDRMTAGIPDGAVDAQPITDDMLLDPLFEAEPVSAPATSFARAEAGALLRDILADAGLDGATLLDQSCAFAAVEIAAAPRSMRSVLKRMPDAEVAALALEAGGVPPWLVDADDTVSIVVQDWLDWYRASVSPLQGSEAWMRERLEYRFAVAAGNGDAQKVFATPAHLGGEIDWYGFDQISGPTLNIPAQYHRASPSRSRSPLLYNPRGARLEMLRALRARTRHALVSPLRYGGMPADRLWEFEDANVSFGSMDVQANDPARLCLIEFATIYGCDWFLAPLDVDASAFTTLDTLEVVDSFGEVTAIQPANDVGKQGRFRLFEISREGSDDTLRGILTLPTARSTLEGAPLENVHFMRDEAANLAWAIEHRVQDASGLVRSRDDETRATVPLPPIAADAELRYTLESTVPDHWIPLVPVPTAPRKGGFILRKGTMGDSDMSVGRILAGAPVDFHDEEIPRGGLRVMRVPSMARDADGTYRRWTALRIGQGRGSGSSALAFDGTDKD